MMVKFTNLSLYGAQLDQADGFSTAKLSGGSLLFCRVLADTFSACSPYNRFRILAGNTPVWRSCPRGQKARSAVVSIAASSASRFARVETIRRTSRAGSSVFERAGDLASRAIFPVPIARKKFRSADGLPVAPRAPLKISA